MLISMVYGGESNGKENGRCNVGSWTLLNSNFHGHSTPSLESTIVSSI